MNKIHDCVHKTTAAHKQNQSLHKHFVKFEQDNDTNNTEKKDKRNAAAEILQNHNRFTTRGMFRPKETIIVIVIHFIVYIYIKPKKFNFHNYYQILCLAHNNNIT